MSTQSNLNLKTINPNYFIFNLWHNKNMNMNMKKWLYNKKLASKKFWLQYEAKIVLMAGFILVAILSFEVGFIKNQETSQKPIIIEKPLVKKVKGVKTKKVSPTSISQQKIETTSNTIPSKSGCLYVGSKNSRLYHLPNSSYAKRIKKENLTSFSSKNEAESKGYQPDKSLAQ